MIIRDYNKNMNTKPGYLLIVEDDSDIRKLLETTLTFRGYQVSTARNGNEGLELIRKEHPAIIITDIMMPRLDGFGLVHRLRLNPETRSIPVIFITATYVENEDREFALNIGATRFIQKPVDLDNFLKTIEELLEEGAHTAIEPLNEFSFYDGYRKRLEVKLGKKITQITRDKRLLESTLSNEDKQALQASLDRDMREREEIKLLLSRIHERLKNQTKDT